MASFTSTMSCLIDSLTGRVCSLAPVTAEHLLMRCSAVTGTRAERPFSAEFPVKEILHPFEKVEVCWVKCKREYLMPIVAEVGFWLDQPQ